MSTTEEIRDTPLPLASDSKIEVEQQVYPDGQRLIFKFGGEETPKYKTLDEYIKEHPEKQPPNYDSKEGPSFNGINFNNIKSYSIIQDGAEIERRDVNKKQEAESLSFEITESLSDLLNNVEAAEKAAQRVMDYHPKFMEVEWGQDDEFDFNERLSEIIAPEDSMIFDIHDGLVDMRNDITALIEDVQNKEIHSDRSRDEEEDEEENKREAIRAKARRRAAEAREKAKKRGKDPNYSPPHPVNVLRGNLRQSQRYPRKTE
jgi:hypothetical protein